MISNKQKLLIKFYVLSCCLENFKKSNNIQNFFMFNIINCQAIIYICPIYRIMMFPRYFKIFYMQIFFFDSLSQRCDGEENFTNVNSESNTKKKMNLKTKPGKKGVNLSFFMWGGFLFPYKFCIWYI